MRRSTGGVKIYGDKNSGLTFINIIGDSFTYDITIQNDPVIAKARESINVNFCSLPPLKNLPGNDNIIYPFGALITFEKLATGNNLPARFPFYITVNFN